MRRLIAFRRSCFGSETPKVEVFGGYSYLFTSVGAGFKSTNFNGGTGSVAFNVNNWLGVVGDFGGYHTGNFAGTHGSVNIISYTFGPKFAYRADKFTLFTQSLFGGAHASSNGTGINAFAMALGGGADVNVTPNIAIRAIQAEYVLTRFNFGVNPASQNNLRVSVGVVFKF